MTSEKLLKLEDIIRPILERDEKARNDDFYLYSRLVTILKPEISELSFGWVLKQHKEYGLPNYESVTRVRRKLQEKYPELESERSRKRRLKECEAYKEYAAT